MTKQISLTTEIEHELQNPKVVDYDLGEEDNEEAFGEDAGVYDEE